MKFLFVAIAMMLSSTSFAESEKIPCAFEDYRLITAALEQGVINKGQEHVDGLTEMLMQEMGPQCRIIVDLELSFGIPGTTSYQYQIDSADRGYNVTVVFSKVTGPKYTMYIERAR